MKLQYHNLIVFITFLFLLSPVFAQQKIIVDASGGGDFTTIQAAFNSLNNSTINNKVEVLIRPGTYDEKLSLSNITTSGNSITITSSTGNAADVILNNSVIETTSDRILTIANTSHVIIKNLTFANSTGTREAFFGIGSGVDDIQILNNILKDEDSRGSYSIFDQYDFTTENLPITNVIIDNNHYMGVSPFAIYYQVFQDITFTNNVVDDAVRSNGNVISNWNNVTNLTYAYNQVNGPTIGFFNNAKNVFIHHNIFNCKDHGMDLAANYEEGHSTYSIYNNFFITEDYAINVGLGGVLVDIAHNNFKTETNVITLNTFFTSEISNRVSVFNNNLYSDADDSNGIFILQDPDSLKEDITIELDYNNYFFPENKDWLVFNQEYTYYSLSEIKESFGLEEHGLSIDPIYQSEEDLHTANIGLQNKGIQLAYITDDIDGEAREGLPDIGADEIQGSVNLVVQDGMAVTGNLQGGKNIQVTYAVKNQGTLRLAGNWTDAVYLSADNVWDESDRMLVDIPRFLALEPGENYDGKVAFQLPNDISGGNYFVIVKVNSGNLQFDKNLSDNTVSTSQLVFAAPQFPDLVVSNIVTPPTQFSGKSFELQWTVTNNGNGPTKADWQDYIYVANQVSSLNDPSILTSDSLFLKRVAAPIALNPGESYTQNVTVFIPLRYSGNLYYRIHTNAGNSITEINESFTANGRNSQVINITQSPLPDLSVQELNLQSTAFSGETVPVNWTVENVGQQTTYRTAIQLNDRDWLNRANYNYWYDVVYISKKPWYDPKEPTQRAVARYDREAEELGAAQTYMVNDSIEFLECYYGWYYVFVIANDDQYTYELTRQNNINFVDSIELIANPMPDLVPTNLSVSNPAYTGQPITITYTITNDGFADKPQSRVMDYFYISTLDTLNENVSTLIGFESTIDPIAQNGSYSKTIELELPFNEFGNYNLFIKTDGEDNICELQGEQNNVKSIPLNILLSDQPDLVPSFSGIPDTIYAGGSYAMTFTVKNNGLAEAREDAWYDKLSLENNTLFNVKYGNVLPSGESYTKTINFTIDLNQAEGTYDLSLFTDHKNYLFEYGYEDNNVASKQVYVSRDLSKAPDLSLEFLEVENTTLTAGDVMNLVYNVLNKSAATPKNAWLDKIRLIDDADNVVWQENVKHLGNIAFNSIFEGTHHPQLPYNLKGNYTLELTLNVTGQMTEYITTNNVMQIPVSIAAYSPPDLQVTAVTYANCCNLFALQEENVSITITNNGPGDIVSQSFTTEVKIAEDEAGSNAKTLLAHRQEFTIPAGESVTITIPVNLYANLSGDYFTIVDVDTDDDIYEDKFNDNNRFVSGYTVNIDNEPIPLYPTEVAIESITSPDFSKTLALRYVVEKGVGKALNRKIDDQVILSMDKQFDADDYRFASFEPTLRIIPAETSTYEDTKYAYLPTYLQPGWYYVGIKVDAGNNVLELDETNNVMFTEEAYYIDFTVPLQLDVPQTLSFREGMVGGQEAFSIQRPADKGMYVTVDFSEDQSSTELFHKVGAMPSRTVFDNRYKDPFIADQEMIVSVTDTATTDYLRLVANRIPWINNSPADFECWLSTFTSGGGGNVIMANPECDLPDPVPYTILAKSAEYSVLRSTPDSASNLGTSNILIEGFDFEDEMTFQLEKDGILIPARRVEILSSTQAMGVFDLRDQEAGVYNLVAQKQTGESTRLPDYFTVFRGSPAIPWASVNHSTRLSLVNRKIYVNVDFGNYAYMNGYDFWLIVAMSTQTGSVENVNSQYIGSSVEDVYQQLPFNPNPTGDSTFVDIDGVRYYAYWIPILPPRSQTTFTYIIDCKSEDYVLTQAYLYEQPLSRFQLEQNLDYVGQSATIAKIIDILLGERFFNNMEYIGKEPTNKSASMTSEYNSEFCDNIDIRSVEKQIANDVKSYAEYIHGGAKAYKGAGDLGQAFEMAVKNKKEALIEAGKGAVDVKGNFIEVNKELGQKQVRAMLKREKGPIETFGDYAKEVWNGINPINKVEEAIKPDDLPFEELINNTFSCLDPERIQQDFEDCYMKIRDDMNGTYRYVRINNSKCNPGGGGSGRGSFISKIVNSIDPNAIVGPEGVTELRMVNKRDKLKYTIMFENKAEASAPARFVSIDNVLPNSLRAQSLMLTEIGFGDTIIQLDPTNRLNYQVQLGKKYNYQDLHIVAGIDAVNNRAFWRLTTIDPVTGNLTQDALNGFLPPNDSTGIGEGFVTYEIFIDPDVATGSEILNSAEITFDQNEVIPTNIWSNIVAGSNPYSLVKELPANSPATFTISWEGDAGDQSAGLLGYDIYVSENEQPFRRILSNSMATQTTFNGTHGSTYKFYSVLNTLDGEIELAPDVADATTIVDTTITGLGDVQMSDNGNHLYAHFYPNPAKDQVFVRYRSRSNVQMSVFDISGRMLQTETLPANNLAQNVDISLKGLPDGVLIIKMDNGNQQQTERLIRIR